MNQTPPTRKQREFLRREQEIVDAALVLFDRQDWQAVTVEKIAQQAEIGKGTVYKHFSCKEEIYASIALAHCQLYMQKWSEAPASTNILDSLEQTLLQAFQISLQNPIGAKVAHYCKREDVQRRLPVSVQKTFEEFEKGSHSFFETLLATGMESGDIPKQSIDELVIALHACYHGTLTMIWEGEIQAFKGLTPERFIKINSQFMLAGILGKRS